MDIQTEKLSLIKWLTDVTEPSVIEQFVALKNNQQIDWWNEIDNDERVEIEEGLKQADAGDFIAHEDVMKKYDQWRSK